MAVVKTPVVPTTVVIGIPSGVTVIVDVVKLAAEHCAEQVAPGDAEIENVTPETPHAYMGVVARAAYEVTDVQPAKVVELEPPIVTEIGVPEPIGIAEAAFAVKTPAAVADVIVIAEEEARDVTVTVVGFKSVPVNVQIGEQPEVNATLKMAAEAVQAKRGVVASAAYDITVEQPATV